MVCEVADRLYISLPIVLLHSTIDAVAIDAHFVLVSFGVSNAGAWNVSVEAVLLYI